MPIPKSKVLESFENQPESILKDNLPSILKTNNRETVTIRPVKCHNNYVAILQTQIETAIQLAGTDGQYKNEGLVIGVGPGISDGNGGRLPLSVKIGDYVMIGTRNYVATLMPDNGHYKGQKVVIVAENNIICDVPTEIKYQIE